MVKNSNISAKVSLNLFNEIQIFYRINLFPLFIPSLPTIHYSMRFTKTMAAKSTVIPVECRNSDIFNYIRPMGGVVPVWAYHLKKGHPS